MWEIGNLVYYDKESDTNEKKSQDSCRCWNCLKGACTMYGIITESWVDEDDTTAIVVDFHEDTSVFRSANRRCLRVVSAL